MAQFTLGYFTKSQALKIKEKLEGKTFYNFKIEVGNAMCDCNSTLVVSSTYTDDAEELKDNLLCYALAELV